MSTFSRCGSYSERTTRCSGPCGSRPWTRCWSGSSTRPHLRGSLTLRSSLALGVWCTKWITWPASFQACWRSECTMRLSAGPRGSATCRLPRISQRRAIKCTSGCLAALRQSTSRLATARTLCTTTGGPLIFRGRRRWKPSSSSIGSLATPSTRSTAGRCSRHSKRSQRSTMGTPASGTSGGRRLRGTTQCRASGWRRPSSTCTCYFRPLTRCRWTIGS
mmetsp:Transcript_23810/g.66057  ORF Transcript_23810/g.66057 Transcript_23810/m.66057 type:complete len:219 (+) Transcript_23810:1256-1912(+)